MANLRVLLADGDNSFRSTAQRALTRQGYLVIPTATGVDAISFLANDNIDLVVSNVQLAQRDGLDVLRAAKSKSTPLPVILVTEASAVGLAKTGVSEGAAEYFVKPLTDMEPLLRAIEKARGTLVQSPSTTITENDTGLASSGKEAAIRLMNAATAGQDLSQLLELYAMEIAQLARSPQSIVLLAHSDGQLHVAASYGFIDRAEAGRAFVWTGGEEFAYQVAAAKNIVDQAIPIPGPEEGETELQQLLGLPLLYAHVTLGVAVVFTNGPRETLMLGAVDAMRYLTQQVSLVVELSRVRGLAELRNPSDQVTGLLNREHFFGLADREFRRSWRFGERIAALQVDVDDYGKLHSLQGTEQADEVIKQVARSVHLHVRNIDVVGRLDKDKLGVLVLNSSRDIALGVAERLRRSIAEIEVPTSEGTWQVTASIGVAIYPREQCASVHDLFGLAAQATRAAKRSGSNRVVGV